MVAEKDGKEITHGKGRRSFCDVVARDETGGRAAASVRDAWAEAHATLKKYEEKRREDKDDSPGESDESSPE